MKVYIRLHQILLEHGLRISDIINDYPELSDYRVRHLMDNSAKEISREVLEKVCSFLIRRKIADRSQLPDILFARSPEHFWHLLYERSRIWLCMGARSSSRGRDHVVVAADSMLQANLLKRMTEAGLEDDYEDEATTPAEESAETDKQSPTPKEPQVKRRPQKLMANVIDPRLVRTWDQLELHATAAAVRAETASFYREFEAEPENKALVCFGSIKSNPVIEQVFATAFAGAEPFHSEDICTLPRDRKCPLYIAYRDDDPQPPSICGGKNLSRQTAETKHGIHYETADGSWLLAPWDERTHDAALVFYRLDKIARRLELVMGGYSGRGTRCLAEFVLGDHDDIDELWPPIISNDEMDVGAFIFKFELDGSQPTASGSPGLFQQITGKEVIRMDAEVLRRRLANIR